jgi:hypothetical protein
MEPKACQEITRELKALPDTKRPISTVTATMAGHYAAGAYSAEILMLCPHATRMDK